MFQNISIFISNTVQTSNLAIAGLSETVSQTSALGAQLFICTRVEHFEHLLLNINLAILIKRLSMNTFAYTY